MDLLERMMQASADAELVLQHADDGWLDGRRVTVDGKSLVNFSSCSYLGLEMSQYLRRAAVRAILRYGTQFSSSRIYVSAPPYRRLEELLREIFGAPTIVTPSTTLGHLAALPLLVGEKDALVLDQQVHNSVHMAARVVGQEGTTVERIRHNRIDLLAERLRELSGTHSRVWYAVDGVYSMYGDLAPMDELYALLDRYEFFRLYVDDAHGMSWAGPQGRGFALSERDLHPQMIMATSLNKSFAAGGGALVVPTEAVERRVRSCGATMIFAGPLQPAQLGAAIASAELHLSGEVERRQRQLRKQVRYCTRLMEECGLPLYCRDESPIRFLTVGLPRVAREVAQRVRDAGYLASVSHFPAVPMKGAGVRVSLTLHQTRGDIEGLVEALDRSIRRVKEGEAAARVKARSGVERNRAGAPETPAARATRAPRLVLERFDTIEELEPALWDRCFGDRGSFGVSPLRLLERVFREGEAENRWSFRYYQIRDGAGTPVLLTFFTHALWKEDMLASGAASRTVEKLREQDPHYLTAPVFSMGSLLTEGNHLFLDRQRADWRTSVSMLLQAVEEDTLRVGAAKVVLRDLPSGDEELASFLVDAGFARLPMPNAMLATLGWEDEPALIASMSSRHRRYYRKHVAPFNDHYRVEFSRGGSAAARSIDRERLYELYLAVQRRNFDLNTFPLPRHFFEAATRDADWEVGLWRRSDRHPGAGSGDEVVGMCVAYRGPRHYAPTVVGYDYDEIEHHGLYRQSIRQILLRAKQLGRIRVHFGMGAELQKRRFEAKPVAQELFVQSEDDYSSQVIAELAAGAVR
ncbi:MAG: bifunctional aminotransferase class I/II-fold pyridoxal phosphate-dependent enzyme/GNAT family N-acetyltransferase [Proteobacteria bacterium]|nr:bifunctional aminotransferase class I/II-fold pyridoxal phosphate-dependent enzyme/GNAT family N-acetyltransferase [Pseudomonadota bacterium]